MKITAKNKDSLQLMDAHKEAPQSVTEDQIKKLRFTTEESITEKLLEKSRTGCEESTLEKRLNDSKGNFNIKHRNSKTSSGNINKLEEKRLSGNKVEDEKYESASSVKKNMRWWEAKTNDGLKIANTNECKKCIISQVNEPKVMPANDTKSIMSKRPKLQISTKSRISDDVDPYDYTESIDLKINGNTYVGTYNPETFTDDEDFAKEVFLSKLTYFSTYFYDYIDPSDVDADNGVLTYTIPSQDMQIAAKTNKTIKKAQYDDQSLFKNLKVEKIDVGGTPTFIGSINFETSFAQNKKPNDIINQAITFIKNKNPEIKLDTDNFDSTKIYNGELSFISSEEGTVIDEKESFASFDFEIVTASNNTKKK